MKRLFNNPQDHDTGLSGDKYQRKANYWKKIKDNNEYWDSHPEERREWLNNYYKKKRETDPMFKLRSNISCSMYQSLRDNKNGRHWETLVNYTLSDIKEHLESLFTDGMTWENQGAWHIDHKRPVSSFNFTKPEDEDFKLCFALSNLQPLWAKDNLEKSDKIDIKYGNVY